MTLPASGPISLSQVNTELGRSSTATISLGESAVRTLFGVASGAISMLQGYGKANQFTLTISSNQTNANLRTLAVNAGWNQSSKVVATINGGVYVSSNGTGTTALTINGSFPNGVELVNNGYIVGMGGAGGHGGGVDYGYAPAYSNSGQAGGVGGKALDVSVPVAITNNGTIAGGGGGGGGGGMGSDYSGKFPIFNAGAGGGGGRSGSTNSSGGSRGYDYVAATATQNGGAGTSSNPGAGGNGTGYGGVGGGGGGWGSAGAAGNTGYQGYSAGAGGGGGACLTGNGNITWLATGTRLGAIG